ncbi:MAG TPA: ATP-dependent sacrificial sulfur transferase LarE, partial [Actinomycetota bacterium]|nr:ATP-dependent sacrificial sulfur transferase LarE [Actinomycetota bacterium]
MEPVDRSDVLKKLIFELPGAVVAYSGGADSAFLADVAHEVLGARMTAVTAVSESLAPDEREQAAGLARARGWRHEEIHTREIERHEYRRNDPDRCFHCKDVLFETLDELASERHAVVLVGTNADDAADFRPGLRAAREHGVRAPMVEAGLHKQEIRELSRARGLPTWDKPASACLASRIAYGIEVTPERLDRVARAEAFLRKLGLLQLRVRDHGDLARIEVPLGNVEQLAEPMVRAQIVEHLKGLGFVHVTLDLEGFRSGSMNASL